MTTFEGTGIERFFIVAIGSFNPAIFQPFWFAENGLIRSEEAREANIKFIHRNVASFSTEWFSVEVTDKRIQLETQDPTKQLPLRDLAKGTFHLLEHTPVDAVGLNQSQILKMTDEDKWHAFGHFLAPKKSWNGIMENPGLRILETEGTRAGCPGRIRIRIQPASMLESTSNEIPGVAISVNEHYELVVPGKNYSIAERNQQFLSILNKNWNGFLGYCKQVTSHLFAEFNQSTKAQKGK